MCVCDKSRGWGDTSNCVFLPDQKHRRPDPRLDHRVSINKHNAYKAALRNSPKQVQVRRALIIIRLQIANS